MGAQQLIGTVFRHAKELLEGETIRPSQFVSETVESRCLAKQFVASVLGIQPQPLHRFVDMDSNVTAKQARALAQAVLQNHPA